MASKERKASALGPALPHGSSHEVPPEGPPALGRLVLLELARRAAGQHRAARLVRAELGVGRLAQREGEVLEREREEEGERVALAVLAHGEDCRGRG